MRNESWTLASLFAVDLLLLVYDLTKMIGPFGII